MSGALPPPLFVLCLSPGEIYLILKPLLPLSVSFRRSGNQPASHGCCLDSTGTTHPFSSITCCSVETDTKLYSEQASESSRFPVMNGHTQGSLFRPQTLVSNGFEVMTQAKRSSSLQRRCQRLLHFAKGLATQNKAGASCDKALRNLEEN